MKILDVTFPSPADNLACDEALLDWCEGGGADELLRFWEPRDYFVVVGYANKVSTEAKIPLCENKGIPIFRRCSGGGTVLQGPGCLNYALLLNISKNKSLQSITSANRFILEKNRVAIQTILTEHGTSDLGLSIAGHTDLTLATPDSLLVTARKFSGNAQRRKKKCLLFHGSFLLNFDLDLVGKLLNMPSLQPDYRQNRNHRDFLTNLGVPADQVKSALCQVWGARDRIDYNLNDETGLRLRNKYVTKEWNLKF